MRLVAYSIIVFCISLLMCGCSGGDKSKVEKSVQGFMNAYKEQNIEQMRVYYPTIDNIEIFYASDTSFIEEIVPIANTDNYEVKVASFYINEENNPEMQSLTFFIQPAKGQKHGFRIVDSQGLGSWRSYPHYKFAVQTGCITPTMTLSDQQASQRLRVAKDLLFYFSKLMYHDLEANIRVKQTKILEQDKKKAHASVIVENTSDYTLPDLKYHIVYYDEKERKIGEESGWVTQEPFESGKAIEFEFYSNYDEATASADFKLDFDLDLIMQFVLEDDAYTGREYEEFIAEKLIDI